MSDNINQPGLSLVFADRDQNYYLIPVETFTSGRVPAERAAELEQALHEQDVAGYSPLLVGLAFVGAAVAGGVAAKAVWDAAIPDGVQAGCFEPRPTTVYT